MAIAIPGLYSGTNFAAIDGKGRVSVPLGLRNAIPLAEDGTRVLWVSDHETLPCLVGFDSDYAASIPAEIDRDEDRAIARGVEYNRAAESSTRFGFAEAYVLDGSGRFVMSSTHKQLAEAKKHLCFVGSGRRFEIWAVEELIACEAADPKRRRMAEAILAEDKA